MYASLGLSEWVKTTASEFSPVINSIPNDIHWTIPLATQQVSISPPVPQPSTKGASREQLLILRIKWPPLPRPCKSFFIIIHVVQGLWGISFYSHALCDLFLGVCWFHPYLFSVRLCPILPTFNLPPIRIWLTMICHNLSYWILAIIFNVKIISDIFIEMWHVSYPAESRVGGGGLRLIYNYIF